MTEFLRLSYKQVMNYKWYLAKYHSWYFKIAPTIILKYHSWYLCQISLQIMLLPIQNYCIKSLSTDSSGWCPPLPPYPARSTRWSLALRMVADPGSRDEMWIVKMQCDLVDAWFMGVCSSQQYHLCSRICFKCILGFPGIPFANLGPKAWQNCQKQSLLYE